MAYISFQPSDYFSTKLYTGTGSSNVLTGIGFQSDLIWTATRNEAEIHPINNSVNGISSYLRSNASDTLETGQTQTITAQSSDGYTVGTEDRFNQSGNTFVSWNWKVDSTSSTNSVGSVDVDLAVNTTAGISIGTYTGDGADGATFGHGLGVIPSVVLVKSTDNATNWYMKHNSQTSNNNLILDSTSAEINASGYNAGIIDDLASTTTWTMTKSGATDPTNNNGSGREYVVYTFAAKKGFSSFGSFTGNGNADGSFFYTGFRPAFILAKNTNSSTDWMILDDKRLGYNEANYRFKANTTVAEASDVSGDILSNGFKIRTTSSDWNTSGDLYVYLAFAEFPLVSSNDMPGVAR